jgi:hypothetical protein
MMCIKLKYFFFKFQKWKQYPNDRLSLNIRQIFKSIKYDMLELFFLSSTDCAQLTFLKYISKNKDFFYS